MVTSPRRHRPRKRPQRSRHGQQSNRILVISGLGIAVVMAANYFSAESRAYREMQTQASHARLAADFKKAQQQQATELAEFIAEQDALAREAEAAIAHDRYQSGCSMIFLEPEAGKYVTQAAALGELGVITDLKTGQPYPPGQEVCDDRFMTAEIGPDGRIDPTTLARATDAKLVNQRFADAAKWHPGAERSFGEAGLDGE